MCRDEWAVAWAKADKTQRYQLIEREARKVLDGLALEATTTTNALVEAMLPELSVRGPSIDVRRAMFSHLLKLAKGTMRDCAVKDMTCEPKLYYGRETRPWVWTRGTMARKAVCPCCLGKGYLAEGDRCKGLGERSAALGRGENDTCQQEIKQDMAQTIA